MITHFWGYPIPIQWESEHIDLSKQSARFYTKFDPLFSTAPPVSFPNENDMASIRDSMVTAGTNTDEISSADEDWVLQKTLERKRSNSVTE